MALILEFLIGNILKVHKSFTKKLNSLNLLKKRCDWLLNATDSKVNVWNIEIEV